jgi:PST family polysaccharide transporter
MGAAYAVRLIILRNSGIDAAGLYHSAWTLGGLYVGFILGAMGADFYPRLTAVSRDNAECNRLVNEQAHIGLLLAGPGVLATLTCAPLVIATFYSAAFEPAVELLRWICLGMMLRIVTWPMGFIVLAKGAQQIFFWVEVAGTVMHVGLAWLLVAQFGLQGSGAAFLGLCLGHGFLIYAIVHRLSGFGWSEANRKLGLVFLPLTGVIFSSFILFPAWIATTGGIVATVLSGIYSVRGIVRVVPLESIPAVLVPALRHLKLVPSVPER